MRDWAIELVEYYQAGAGLDTDEFPAVDAAESIGDDDSTGSPAAASRAEVKVPKASPIAIGIGALLLVGVLAGGGLVVKGVLDASSPAPELAVDAASCEGEPMADLVTPAGVVVAFQRAYFSGDVKGIEKTLADSSPLAQHSFADVVPDGDFDVCVEVERDLPLEVTAYARVADAQRGQVVVYHQRWVFDDTDAGPRIVTIEDVREG